ncbi:hypothetical protein [Streptomyces sp. FIT100]|uniref:hypothetical protein n=1 Tax=Streptomyces sp. FIT100 TaxID=2837956 RepID=UPI0021C975A8|nr:hypothetical protein [Streptomyces sp. FIT100]UUN25312.1 hypothetical protein KK483_01945 [Streptomyces sp. FIT100]
MTRTSRKRRLTMLAASAALAAGGALLPGTAYAVPPVPPPDGTVAMSVDTHTGSSRQVGLDQRADALAQKG